MKEKIFLILGSHAHVPSGAGEKEFQYVYENKMRPFVSNLYRYSNIQAVLHYSGVLLYWVERNHSEFFMLIEDMVARRQVEILSGGFYEPMLPLIPLQDRIGQIELMTTYLRKHFGKRPLGCWIPGMTWEQHLAAALAASDMHYTFLSQDQFIQAGLSGKDIYFPCISEDQGKLITVFPVSMSVQALLAQKSFSQVFNERKNMLSPDSIISVFPEEPFSDPQEAQDTAWNRFFEELSLSKDFVETVLPAKVIRTNKTLKKASFPNSSSLENNFSPRRFLIEHCGANGIYSKMIFTSVLINQLKGDKYRKQNAREELWKAQDSCLFTPGNGFLRHELRKAAYSSLLRAERLSREKGRFISSLIKYDFDLDGVNEYLFQDARINCYIQQKGASVFELDYLPKDWNYLDCGSCSPAKERRTAFADALIPEQADLKNGFPDGSRLCFNEQYEEVSQDRKGKSCFKLPADKLSTDKLSTDKLSTDKLSTDKLSTDKLSTDKLSTDKLSDSPYGGIEIEKCYLLKKDVLSVNYVLKNSGDKPENFTFVTEIDFSFAGSGEEFARFYTTDKGGKDIPTENILNNAETLKILDINNEVQLLLGSAKPFSGCMIPAFDDGLYQANRILPQFAVSLKSGESWANEFSLKFSH